MSLQQSPMGCGYQSEIDMDGNQDGTVPSQLAGKSQVSCGVSWEGRHVASVLASDLTWSSLHGTPCC